MCVSIEELDSYLLAINCEWCRTNYGPKASVERFLIPGAGFLPDRIVIPRSIIGINDIEVIQKKLYEGIESGYSMGIRTIADKAIFGGGKLDWVLQIDSEEKADNFLEETLTKWQINARKNNYNISQLVLMNNLPEIGTTYEQPNQFVLRVAWNNCGYSISLRSQLLIEMALETNNLRKLDQKMEEGDCNTVRYQCIYKETGFLDYVDTQIGKNITDLKHIKTVHSAISQLNFLIKDPEIQFIKRLDFFSRIGLNTIEFQGCIFEGLEPIEMLVYGLRGTNDETLTGLKS